MADTSAVKTIIPNRLKKKSWLKKATIHLNQNKYLYMMISPVILHFFIFQYIPMYGVIIAFKDFSVTKGILHSDWVGLKYFYEFFNSFYFFRTMKNTLLISVYTIIFQFPVPIIFALLLNEIKDGLFKRSIQTITYLPHFISIVIVVGLMANFLNPSDGIINKLLDQLFGYSKDFMGDASWFRTLYISSDVWQQFGWGSIIYLAALSGIDPALYEASAIEGANRWQQMRHITLPGLMPTAVMILILNIGGLLSVGFEKIILMYNPMTYETADVISTYVYRKGVLGAQYSYAAAVGLFNSVVAFILLFSANRISRKVSEISLW